MRGIWLEDKTLTLREDLDTPSPARGEALIRVTKAGICQTDLELANGYYPFAGIPGHEFVGIVADSTAGQFLEGQRVVGEINVVCHSCSFCRRGLPNHCSRRSVLGIVGKNGAFAEYLTLPIENLHAVPDAVSDEAATFVEPLAAALQILEQIHLSPGDLVVVVGAGRLGQLIARAVARTSCRLRVLARHPHQARLLEDVGIQTTGLEQLSAGSIDVVVEATGTAAGLETACSLVRPRGTVVIKSTYAGKASLDFSRVVVDEISIVGSRCGPFKPALALLEKGVIDPLPLVDKSYPLAEGMTAVSAAAQQGAMKILLDLR